VTATRHWIANAALTPIHTGSARNRVASTRAATNVLSGSSTGKISAKLVSRAVRSMAFPGSPEVPLIVNGLRK
jgi:hypothetical protein